ncbi:MAG: hypothetical protein Q7R45_05950, partial [Sulfuricaulis sp.]|nr:hypothetical protein [Sulfuricaulis sp.]
MNTVITILFGIMLAFAAPASAAEPECERSFVNTEVCGPQGIVTSATKIVMAVCARCDAADIRAAMTGHQMTRPAGSARELACGAALHMVGHDDVLD